jgi:glycosyltransferase involved in cell wall biosynthesis
MADLVSVGIPAYNRPEELERAARSALRQDHRELEVVVSDDASSDPRVAETAARLAAQDPRVRIMTQPRNLGHVGNYRAVLEAARGEYFMWLSDDDWLDPGYVSSCLRALQTDPAARLVCGQALYETAEGEIDERPIDLTSPSPAVRVIRYFARMNMNGPLFGVARRADLLATPFQEVPGGDWLLVSAFAARGRVRTLTGVHIHRSTEGLGSDPERLGSSFGLRGPFARYHHLWHARYLWGEIVRREPAYRAIPLPARILTATIASALVVLRFPGMELARKLGLGPLERWAIACVRARDRRAAQRR